MVQSTIEKRNGVREMIIATHRDNLWIEVYTSDDEPHPADALRQWLNRRKVGRRAFTRKEELALAMELGVALAKKARIITFQGETIELIY